jgi:hypothetical protein
MKNKQILLGLVAGLSVLALVLVSNTNNDESSVSNEVSVVAQSEGEEREDSVDEIVYEIAPSDYLEVADFLPEKAVSPNALSEAEENGLLLMREEEKLARDVYTVLADKWQLNIFSNIAQSEQTHMNVMGGLLETYSITDPVVDDTVGVFTNPELQALYLSLVSEGSVSRDSALKVGAQIEDLDIYDLERLLSETNKPDIISAYQNLQKGSRNHLRAFIRQIERNGGSYTPSYISVSDYQNIINAQQERGRI